MTVPRFHYKIKPELMKLKDGKCCQDGCGSDRWHTHRCSKKAIKSIDGVGLCGTHANSLLRWRKDVGAERGEVVELPKGN
jgi:hypothetical protein